MRVRYRFVMSGAFGVVDKMNLERQQEEQNRTIVELVDVLRTQTETAKRSQKASARMAFGWMAIATGSLATAVIALLQ